MAFLAILVATIRANAAKLYGIQIEREPLCRALQSAHGRNRKRRVQVGNDAADAAHDMMVRGRRHVIAGDVVNKISPYLTLRDKGVQSAVHGGERQSRRERPDVRPNIGGGGMRIAEGANRMKNGAALHGVSSALRGRGSGNVHHRFVFAKKRNDDQYIAAAVGCANA